MDSLATALQKEGIKAVLRQNKDGIIYGLTYIDHRTKCVFNGSDLGKQYSAKGTQERCNERENLKRNEEPIHHHATRYQEPKTENNYKTQNSIKDILASSNIDKAIDDVILPSQTSSYVPHQFKKNKKKKRKNILYNP